MKNIQQHIIMAAMLVTFAMAQNEAEKEYKDSIYKGVTPKESFYKMSAEMNVWSSTSTAGAGIGFAVFALSYIYTVGAIFFDISKSKKEYIDLIEFDKKEIQRLELSAAAMQEI